MAKVFAGSKVYDLVGRLIKLSCVGLLNQNSSYHIIIANSWAQQGLALAEISKKIHIQYLRRLKLGVVSSCRFLFFLFY